VHGQVAAATCGSPRLLQIIYLRNFTFIIIIIIKNRTQSTKLKYMNNRETDDLLMIYLVTAGSFRICT